MENKKNTNNLDVNPEQEETSALDEINVDELLTDDYAEAIEASSQIEENGDDPEAEEPKPRRRGRPKKNGTSSKQTKQTKSKNGSSTGVRKNTTTVPPQTYARTTEKKKSTSFLNLVLFALIFAALVAAQFIMKMDNKKEEKMNVSAVEITAEEEIAVAENPVTEEEVKKFAGETAPVEMSDKVEVVKKVEEKVATTGPEKETKTEVAEIEEKVAEPEKIVEEKVVVTEPKKETKEEVKVVEKKTTPKVSTTRKRTYRNYSGSYRPDPWTNGSSLDLDGSSARKQYREGNYVKVERRVYKPKNVKKYYYYDEPYYGRTYSDTRYKEVDRYPGGYGEHRVREYKTYPKRGVEMVCTPYYSKPVERKERTTYSDRSYDNRSYKKYKSYNKRYSDTKNPWNSGGISDLDHQANQPRHTTTITRRYYGY